MNEHANLLQYHTLKETLSAEFESSVNVRILRQLEMNYQKIIGHHHFAEASTECLRLYRDGFFLSVVMVSQSVAEAIFRFVVLRNGLTMTEDEPQTAKILVEKGILSQECADAFIRIWQSSRNDVHHMNPKVTKVPFTELAKQNIQDLGVVEREVFAYRVAEGRLAPENPKYWDLKPDGTVPVFLRIEL